MYQLPKEEPAKKPAVKVTLPLWFPTPEMALEHIKRKAAEQGIPIKGLTLTGEEVQIHVRVEDMGGNTDQMAVANHIKAQLARIAAEVLLTPPAARRLIIGVH